MKRHALLTGVFVAGAIVLVVATVLLLGTGGLFGQSLRAVVYFEGSVRGLYIGAPVTFRGVKVGEVDDIDIDVDPATLATRIPVGLTIRAGSIRIGGQEGKRLNSIPDLVQRGLRARLVLQSVVTGQTGIDLDLKPGTPARLLSRGRSRVPEIPAARDRLDALLEQLTTLPLNDLLGDVRRTMATLNDALRTTQAGVDRASQQLVRTAEQAERTLAVGSGALETVQQQTRSTLAAVETLSRTSEQVLKQTAPDLQQSLRSAREAADAARVAMGQVAELSAPGAPVRADLEGAMRDLALSARNLRTLSERLERKPNALIFGGDREP